MLQVEFTYVHALQQNKFVKMTIVQDGATINVTFRISERNPGVMARPDEVINLILKIDETEFGNEKFDNLDSWFLGTNLLKEYAEMVEKRVTKTTAPASGGGIFRNPNSQFFSNQQQPPV